MCPLRPLPVQNPKPAGAKPVSVNIGGGNRMGAGFNRGAGGMGGGFENGMSGMADMSAMSAMGNMGMGGMAGMGGYGMGKLQQHTQAWQSWHAVAAVRNCSSVNSMLQQWHSAAWALCTLQPDVFLTQVCAACNRQEPHWYSLLGASLTQQQP